MAAEQRDDFLRLACAQEAVIHEDAGELVADCFVNEQSGDRGVDAGPTVRKFTRPRRPASGFGDRLTLERLHVPVRRDASDVLHEIREQRRAPRRVHDFGMKHDAIKRRRSSAITALGRILAFGDDAKPVGQRSHAVAMAHPHIVARAKRPHAVE